MKLIVGLGNPSKAYINSRHNIGFLSIKSLAKNYRASLKKDKHTLSLTAKARVGNQSVLLALPVTFMNLSGSAVKALIKKYKIDLDNLLVVCDDLDLKFGRFKIKPSGSSGGHRGLKSIIDYLRTEKFSRLRIGIGRPPKIMDASEYVLGQFSPEEKRSLKIIMKNTIDCCKVWVTKGITESMNLFNQRYKL